VTYRWIPPTHRRFEPPCRRRARDAKDVCAPRGTLTGPEFLEPTYRTCAHRARCGSSARWHYGPRMRVHGRWLPMRLFSQIVWRRREPSTKLDRRGLLLFRVHTASGRYDDCPF
jgi:hypothetical protein